MDVALRVQNYLSTIMRGAKRARQITMNPALDLAGSIHAPRTIHRPALSTAYPNCYTVSTTTTAAN